MFQDVSKERGGGGHGAHLPEEGGQEHPSVYASMQVSTQTKLTGLFDIKLCSLTCMQPPCPHSVQARKKKKVEKKQKNCVPFLRDLQNDVITSP
jgi:hypothetical protein